MVTIDNPFNAPGTWIFRLGNANIDSMKIYSKDLLATAEVPGVSKSGYEITAAYDNIHNITNKSFKKQLYIGGTTYKKTSYDREYLYDPARPHAVVNMRNNALPFWHIFRHYEYDANGNVTQHNNYNRQILWDEENRIKQVTDTFPRTAPVSENYFYDHKGERKIKVNNYNTGAPQLGDVAMYVNQYAAMWLSNANNVNTYTKNYYVGNQRVASRIMSDAACATGTDSFDFTYFYGTDHLGSSTYLTDALGDIVEHNEYTPWGEIWQTEDNMPVVSVGELNNPFKFTGKEMDRTGLYYYGARYYDPQVSLWMSPDPILDKYLPKLDEKDNSKLPGMGGVYNSLNLGLFTYTHQNPVKMIDPDGNDVILLNDSRAAALYGHNAQLIGDNKNGWTYYSKDGYGKSMNQSISFKNVRDFRMSEQAKRFDRGAYFKTSGKQDMNMIKYADNNFEKPYNVHKEWDPETPDIITKENCADLSEGVLNAGDINTPSKTDWNIFVGGEFTSPNKQFETVAPSADMIIQFDGKKK